MWADNVDQWLEENSIKGGNKTGNTAVRLQVGIWVFIMKLMFYFGTFGIGYLIARALRSNEKWYYENISNRKNKICNISNPSEQNVIKSILEAEMITIGNDEEILFLIKNEADKKQGIIFTNKRMVYKIVKPDFTAVIAETSGQIPIDNIGKSISAETAALSVVIKVNGEKVGKILDDRPQFINAFLDTVRKCIVNERIA